MSESFSREEVGPSEFQLATDRDLRRYARSGVRLITILVVFGVCFTASLFVWDAAHDELSAWIIFPVLATFVCAVPFLVYTAFAWFYGSGGERMELATCQECNRVDSRAAIRYRRAARCGTCYAPLRGKVQTERLRELELEHYPRPGM